MDLTTSVGNKPKILLIAEAHSSHTHSWIELLPDSAFDARLFGVKGTVAPSSFPFQVYSTGYASQNSHIMNYLRWRTEMLCHKLKRGTFTCRTMNRMSRLFGKPEFWFQHFEEEWLAQIIMYWQPDIIHTLGLEPASYIYLKTRNRFDLGRIGRWVATVRGGPELALMRNDPTKCEQISQVLAECDSFIADNELNYGYALELGLDRRKIISRRVTPGTGGVDVDRLRALRKTLPSKQRVILIPKAYECPASKVLPVLEALKLCWDQISPCTVHLMAHDEEMLHWYRELPEKIRSRCVLKGRIPRELMISAMAEARIVLAPSLIDGIPNTLYEAMATGAFPIFSPLESFSGLVRDGENILFARNLYPGEIAEALVRGNNDDELVDSAAAKNLSLVRDLADRSVIAEDVQEFYRRYLPLNR